MQLWQCIHRMGRKEGDVESVVPLSQLGGNQCEHIGRSADARVSVQQPHAVDAAQQFIFIIESYFHRVQWLMRYWAMSVPL